MKTVNVVAAIIRQGGKVLATQRGYGEWEGWWEFPGGKVEPGEAPEQALERTTDKFISRFSQVEQGAAAQGKHLEEMSVDEMMALWNAAKRKGGEEV